jgi:UDP-N-acetylmuramoyl-L-alanyl-D-glutamate--2,6-diaminopimelate ligase
MGLAAVSLADVVIVTSDNPRSEDPERIIDEILDGVPIGSARRESDRRLAIGVALSMATANDIVLIAGKGHETTQVIGTQVLAFDDRVHVREMLK